MRNVFIKMSINLSWAVYHNANKKYKCICMKLQCQHNLSKMHFVHQVEYHPFQQPSQLIEYCRQEGIVFEGYSPLAKGQVLSNHTVLQIAEKYSRTPAQICVRWSIQVATQLR